MSENSKIEWTDHTFNPWIGCTKVSPGCDHCYAERDMAARLKVVQWGPHGARVRTKPANWAKPVAWNRRHDEFFAQHGRRQRVFCASLADVFDNQVDGQWRADLFALIEATPNLDWLLLTKRIGNVARMVPEACDMIDYGEGWQSMWGQGVWPENVWLGASIVNQEEADRDIPKLLEVPARVRFLSMEPLLGPVDLTTAACKPCPTSGGNLSMDPTTGAYECCSRCDFTGIGDEWGIDWVIVGGESGPSARPMHPEWARSLRDQCAAAGVPFLFKQWGEWLPAVDGRSVLGKTLILEGAARLPDKPHWHGFEGGQQTARVGKKAAGRKLDGVQHDGYPVGQ
ncbi:protein gp37 [Massilia sp. PDC64]|nr:phage Gp37/Gp68 family protein [Massilia sp. PDC64]SDC67843.1 protein gp37 [Massilia sp. PDC64]